MPRFKDTFTGVTVDVSEERGAELPDRFEPVEKPRKAAPIKK